MDEDRREQIKDWIFRIFILILALFLLGYGVIKIGIPAYKYFKETKQSDQEMDDFITALNNNPVPDSGASNDEVEDGNIILPTDKGYTVADIRGRVAGIITIEAINVQAPVAEGTDEQTLQAYAGLFTEYDPLGTRGGNTAIAAHSSRYNYFCSYCYFQKLAELVPGDIIEVLWKDGNTYRYRVFDVKSKVDPNDFSAFNRIEGKEVLTLQTCTDGFGEYRTFVHAERVN